MSVSLIKFSNRKYEVITRVPSPFPPLDSLEVYKFDSRKRAEKFLTAHKLKVDFYEELK